MTISSPLAVDAAKVFTSRTSTTAWFGVLIAVFAAFVATALDAWISFGGLSIGGMLERQKTNPTLWVLDCLPIAYAIWGQGVQVVMQKRAQEIVNAHAEQYTAFRAAEEKRANRAANLDLLTDLPNRVRHRQVLEQMLYRAAKSNQRVLLLQINIEKFRQVNESLGIPMGDRVLRSLSLRLLAIKPQNAELARTGADEFMLAVPQGDDDATPRELAQLVQQVANPPFELGKHQIALGVRMGGAMYPDHSVDADQMLQHADVATEKARTQTADFRYVLYDDSMRNLTPERFSLLAELRDGIDRDELRMYYQPQVDAKTLNVVGVEALIRWQHPDRGLVFPNDFITLAENAGLMGKITEWVVNAGLRDNAKWRQRGLDMALSVNISPDILLDAAFPTAVITSLERHNVPSSRLALEITETAIMSDEETCSRQIKALEAAGIEISIDDFGTGYSSLYYLKTLPFREIKIDRSFVMDMIDSESDNVIVKTTLQLGHNLGLRVVAEGVESAEHVARLQALGCDLLQGFHFSPAISSDDLFSWVAARNTTT